jgi:hypothetical protein
MMNNKAFSKSLYILSRPISLGAIAVLFINDYLLRRLWPSWWTGKIGDFAWLFFAPFALAALLSWLIPSKMPDQEKIVGMLAFGLTGAVFTLGNTTPAFHGWIIQTLESLLAMPIGLRLDPTDLIALVSLVLGWRLWNRPIEPSPSFARPGWIALSLAALLTVGNSTIANYGIHCLEVQGDRILAHGNYDNFTSTDGGMTWQPVEENMKSSCKQAPGQTIEDPFKQAPGQTIEDPLNTNTFYRYSPGCIQKSEDGGKTWQVESEPPFANEAEKRYFENHLHDVHNSRYAIGPLDAVGDPATGNILFAMGYEGILLRKGNGEWQWVAIGDYSPHAHLNYAAIIELLNIEIILAAGFGLLIICTLALRMRPDGARIFILGLLWIPWLGCMIFNHPAIRIISITFNFIRILVGIILTGCTLDAIIRIYKIRCTALIPIIVTAVFGSLLFLLPYGLWSVNIIPKYSSAIQISLALGAASLFAGWRWAQGKRKEPDMSIESS